MSFINIDYSKAKNSVDGLQIFPVEQSNMAVFASNFYRVSEKLHFDLNISNLNNFFDTIKIVSLSEQELISLQDSGFPIELSDNIRRKLFSVTPGDTAFSATNMISSIEIDLNQVVGQNFKILVNIIDSRIEFGQTFLLSINRQDIIDKTNLTSVSIKDFKTFKQSDSTTILEILDENAYTSNLIYSFSNNRTLTGLFAINAQRFIDERTKFPNLIDVDNELQFQNFLVSSQVELATYDSAKFGYDFEEVFAIVGTTTVGNLKVKNSDTYKFYNFSIANLNPYAEYETKLIIYFNDITIEIAQQLLTDLRGVRTEKNRQEAIDIILRLFGNNIPAEYQRNVDKFEIISKSDFDSLVDKIITLFSDEIKSATERVVANQHVASQYTTPYFSLFNSYVNNFEQSFDKKIKINSNNNNTFINLTDANFFKTISANQISLGDRKYIKATVKSFEKIKNLLAIPSFSITSIQGEAVSQLGLINQANCGDVEQRADAKINFEQPEQALSLITRTERDIKIFYLENLGGTVSALDFKEIDQKALDLLEPGEKLLARLDNYEEFYDSYFYIEGSSVE
tara:strand:+ start:6546 stop:8252 length:1707 start_codon:yes stop_codon:yes gene_type:complete